MKPHLSFLLLLATFFVVTPGRAEIKPAEDDPVKEAEQLHEKDLQTAKQLNNANPLSADYQKLAPDQMPLTGPAAQFQKLLAPLKVLADPRVREVTERVLQNPNRMTLLWAQVGWMIALFIFKSWRLSKGAVWYSRVWTRIWTFGLYWSGALGVIPYFIIRTDFLNLIQLIKTIKL